MNIAIVGAGAAGLFLARKLSELPAVNVSIFEKTKKIGTKIKASGGGKANIFNTVINSNCYNQNIQDSLLQEITPSVISDEFSKMGLLMTEDEEHRVYPATLFSETIVDILTENISKATVFLEHPITEITPSGNKWRLNGCDTEFDKVVIAIGSPAAMIARNRKGFSELIDNLCLKYKNFEPSLVGFKIKNYPKELFGCRTRAIVTLLQNGKEIHKEKGEVVFKEDGISGIVILNCSAYYNRLKDKSNCILSLNFLYNNPHYDAAAHLFRHGDLRGILHPKLNQLLLKQHFAIDDFRLEIDKTYDLEFAQVCSGGVALSEIDNNFELKRHRGIHLLGEVLDVDGVCGGYNLFFAFASALKLYKFLADEN
ncbi:MAG: NAD(P)/FAD-dependent oxidoreductase [Bacteroidales bacterium]|nr:NAD(P)/FAD-dependent oxidoreductase [Bacteroidales bacterium]